MVKEVLRGEGSSAEMYIRKQACEDMKKEYSRQKGQLVHIPKVGMFEVFKDM